MFQALTRIMLALAMAFTFAGQMEAAAAHCAQLAQADAAAAAADQPDCHGVTNAEASAHHPAPHQPDAPAPDHCECIAALKVFGAPAAMPGSACIAPYAWLTVADAHFASVEPAPGLRPPRA